MCIRDSRRRYRRAAGRSDGRSDRHERPQSEQIPVQALSLIHICGKGDGVHTGAGEAAHEPVGDLGQLVGGIGHQLDIGGTGREQRALSLIHI